MFCLYQKSHFISLRRFPPEEKSFRTEFSYAMKEFLSEILNVLEDELKEETTSLPPWD